MNGQTFQNLVNNLNIKLLAYNATTTECDNAVIHLTNVLKSNSSEKYNFRLIQNSTLNKPDSSGTKQTTNFMAEDT
jgi:hypothetical protein